MALKMGKTREEINELVKQRKELLEQGDITERYGELVINVTPDDLGTVKKGNEKALEDILKKAKDKVVELSLFSLSESPNNHFSRLKGEKREELIGSLKSYGQINPIIVRPKTCVEHYQDEIENDFEILVGHTRVDCMKEIGLKTVKAIIVSCDDVEATLLINQSNIQREKVSDIELARAYKATYDALKQDKGGNDKVEKGKKETLSQDEVSATIENGNVEISTSDPKSQSGTLDRTDELVAQKYGISKNTLRRKMALADCTDRIIKQYNRGKITQGQIQYISKLSPDVQDQVVDVLKESGHEMTKEIAKNLLEAYHEEQEHPTFRVSFPLNTTREVIAKGQGKEDTDETKRRRRKVKKSEVEKNMYFIPEKYFPATLPPGERISYIRAALTYMIEKNIAIRPSKEISQE